MKSFISLLKVFAASLALCTSAFGATLVPVQLLNPTGSMGGQAILSTGPASAPAWGNVTLSGLASIAANTVVANATSTSAAPTAFAMPSCSTPSSALDWTTNSGFTCNTSINAATLGGSTFAAPSCLGCTTPAAVYATTLAAGSGSTAIDVVISNTNGNGAELQMYGNGAATPGKILRVNSGSFQIINNADSAVILALDDSGDLSFSGSFSHTGQEIDKSYTYSTPTTGSTVTLASGTETAIIAPAATLVALTVTLPACASAYDGSIARYSSTQAITTLTVNATSGTVSSAPTTLAAGAGHGMLCRGSSTTWYPLY